MSIAISLSPNCKETLEDYLCDEANCNEFLLRIGAVLFSEDCDFIYNPQQQQYIEEIFDTLELNDIRRSFLRRLDKDNSHIKEVHEDRSLFDVFEFYGEGGNKKQTDNPFICKEIFEYDTIGLLEFSKKKQSDMTLIITPKGKEKKIVDCKVLSSFKAYIDWKTLLLPRSFDESYKKHLISGDVTNSKYWESSGNNMMRCDIAEAKRVLPIAFYKGDAEEKRLYHYHEQSHNTSVLFFKMPPNTAGYHAYHLDKLPLYGKFDVGDLAIYSQFAYEQYYK